MGLLPSRSNVGTERSWPKDPCAEGSLFIRYSTWIGTEFIRFRRNGLWRRLEQIGWLDHSADGDGAARTEGREQIRGRQLRHYGPIRLSLWRSRPALVS